MHHCTLCGRQVTRANRHHLVPKTRHRLCRDRKTKTSRELGRTVWLCYPCHRHVHAVLSERQLHREYDSVDKLREHPEVAKFVRWIRSKPDGTTVTVRRARNRRR